MTDIDTLPGGCTARPASDADLDAVVRLLDDADQALGLDPDPIREFLTWSCAPTPVRLSSFNVRWRAKDKRKRVIVCAIVAVIAGASAVPVLAGGHRGDDAEWRQMSEADCRAAVEESGVRCGWAKTVTP